jgi:hypothetical protein
MFDTHRRRLHLMIRDGEVERQRSREVGVSSDDEISKISGVGQVKIWG